MRNAIEHHDQTTYACAYCGKRYLTKQGCKLHMKLYCKHPESPADIERIEYGDRTEFYHSDDSLNF